MLFHAIHGMPWRTPLLGAFAAGERGITTTRSLPLLSPAVPWLMPQPCPGKDRGPWLTGRYPVAAVSHRGHQGDR